jgi:catecholate siderophore receptor
LCALHRNREFEEKKMTRNKDTAIGRAAAEFRKGSAPRRLGSAACRPLAPVALGLISAHLCGVATAQEAGQVTLPPITVGTSPQADQSYLAKRTSTATKTNTPIINIPQSIDVVTQEQIQDRAAEGLAEALRYVPGVTFAQGESNRDTTVIRGQASTADFFIDGVRDDAQYFRDLYNIQRVEVLKGPNAMIFGRGGGGGIINRVTKEAYFSPLTQIYGQLGSFGNRRVTVDTNQPFTDSFAGRLLGLYENSNSYRNFVNLERYGVNPTLTFLPDDRTKIRVGYEFFSDNRTADRGIPSLLGKPFFGAGSGRFFGNPFASTSNVDVNAGQVLYERDTELGIKVRNFTRAANYDKFYQNVFANGRVDPITGLVRIDAYNNTTNRTNLFNQLDLTGSLSTGPFVHRLLVGTEFGYQDTFNLRRTGFFNNDSRQGSVLVSSLNSLTFAPVTYVTRAQDADSSTVARVWAVYAQDQLELSPNVQLVGGVRYDNFNVGFRNLNPLGTQFGQALSQVNNLVSPRAGMIVKPQENLSFYGSYSVSYLPATGDQFVALAVNQLALQPEQFTNYEGGVKWEPTQDLLVTLAFYQLDRTNTTLPNPFNAAQLVQTGAQRSRGAEIGIAGNLTEAWQIFGGYAYQDVRIVSDTTAAKAGTIVPLTPNHVFSLWNKYQIDPAWAVGLGTIYQSYSFAGLPELQGNLPAYTVTLPGYFRLDGAVYYKLNDSLRAQVNIENLTNTKYYPTAHNNNNITPGSPIAVRVGVTATF